MLKMTGNTYIVENVENFVKICDQSKIQTHFIYIYTYIYTSYSCILSIYIYIYIYSIYETTNRNAKTKPETCGPFSACFICVCVCEFVDVCVCVSLYVCFTVTLSARGYRAKDIRI